MRGATPENYPGIELRAEKAESLRMADKQVAQVSHTLNLHLPGGVLRKITVQLGDDGRMWLGLFGLEEEPAVVLELPLTVFDTLKGLPVRPYDGSPPNQN